MIDEGNVSIRMDTGGTILTGKAEVLRQKPLSVPLCQPQIPHGLIWDRRWAFSPGGQWPTAWTLQSV